MSKSLRAILFTLATAIIGLLGLLADQYFGEGDPELVAPVVLEALPLDAPEVVAPIAPALPATPEEAAVESITPEPVGSPSVEPAPEVAPAPVSAPGAVGPAGPVF